MFGTKNNNNNDKNGKTTIEPKISKTQNEEKYEIGIYLENGSNKIIKINKKQLTLSKLKRQIATAFEDDEYFNNNNNNNNNNNEYNIYSLDGGKIQNDEDLKDEIENNQDEQISLSLKYKNQNKNEQSSRQQQQFHKHHQHQPKKHEEEHKENEEKYQDHVDDNDKNKYYGNYNHNKNNKNNYDNHNTHMMKNKNDNNNNDENDDYYSKLQKLSLKGNDKQNYYGNYNNNNNYDNNNNKMTKNNSSDDRYSHYSKLQKPHKSGINKSNCIILMGECGSGKSTFLNYLCNYFAKLKPPHVIKFTDTSSNLINKSESMKGHTQKCCIWGPFNNNNIDYHIIDTPGLSDPEGIEKDKQHIEEILRFVSECDTVIGIILIVNGTASRFTENLQLAFNKFECNLPDDVLNNSCVVFTNCDLQSDCNFNIDMIQFLKKPKHIYVQNSYKFGYNYNINDDEFEQQFERWNKSMKRIDTIISFFNSKQAQITQSFKIIRETKKQLKLQLSQVYQEISTGCKNEDMLKEVQQKLATAEKTKNLNQNFKTTKTKKDPQWKDCSHHNTICRKCMVVCHEGCGLQYTPGGGEVFSGCACISNGTCRDCKCSYTTHYHDKKTIEQKTLTVEDIDQNMKNLFDTAVKDLDDLKKRQQIVEQSIKDVQNKRKQNMDNVKKLCQDLKNCCSRYNLVNELSGELTVMKSYKERANTIEEANKWQDCIYQTEQLIKQWSQK